MANKLNGVYIPVFTSYDKDDKVNEEALRYHCRYLLDECKVQGLIPCGSTGGFAYMHDDERELVIKTVLEEAKGKGEVYAGTASCATRDVVRYTREAMSWGSDGVMIVPPYYGGLSQEELFQHYKNVAEGAPEAPIILYNNPFTSHSDILPETVERLSAFDNIIAIKETTGIMQRVKDIQYRVGNKIEVVCGCDTLPFEFFLCGVTAWISGPGNLLAKQSEMLYQLAVVQKDFEKADAFFKDVRLAYEIIENGPYVAMVIAGLSWRGHPVGTPRQPVLPLTEEFIAPLKKELKRLGYKVD